MGDSVRRDIREVGIRKEENEWVDIQFRGRRRSGRKEYNVIRFELHTGVVGNCQFWTLRGKVVGINRLS